MLDHVKLFVSDVDGSREFYERALQPLGYRVLLEPAPGVVGLGRDFPNFWLAQAEGAPTTAHVAIRADSRSVVDEFHEAALAAGGTDNGAPGLRPHYHPTYYGAFVHDPDGNNVEAVCHNPTG
jgi:catechol 2,3-dioxygenase-like lactoylglutathione lyase family enzyme